MSVSRIILGILALAAIAAAGVGASGAAFTSASKNPVNSFAAANDWTGPSVTLANPGSPVRGTVALSATATDNRSSMASVTFQRRPSSGGQWSDIGSDAQTPFTANWNTSGLTDGSYDLRAVALDAAGNSTTSAVVATRLVDNTAPTATLANPGSPLSGTVNLGVTADDAGSGIARVAVQYSPAGAGNWTEIGSDTQPPYAVSWNTTGLADGAYDLRATVLDAAGNAGTSATIAGRQVANSSITLEDPGDYLRGTVTLNATASASGGVQKVEFQAREQGTSNWYTVTTDNNAPYTASYNSSVSEDGTWEVRAVMTTSGGATLGSAIRTVTVDNTAPTGTNVQGTPRLSGGTARIESGDALSLTWSEKTDSETLFSGWTGTSAATVYVRVTHNSAGDRIEFFRNTGATLTTGLGLVSPGVDLIDSGSTVTFTSTLALNAAGTTATITLGAASGNTSGLNTVGNGTLRWTPSAAAKDLAGNSASTTQVTESGSADRDF